MGCKKGRTWFLDIYYDQRFAKIVQWWLGGRRSFILYNFEKHHISEWTIYIIFIYLTIYVKNGNIWELWEYLGLYLNSRVLSYITNSPKAHPEKEFMPLAALSATGSSPSGRWKVHLSLTKWMDPKDFKSTMGWFGFGEKGWRWGDPPVNSSNFNADRWSIWEKLYHVFGAS